MAHEIFGERFLDRQAAWHEVGLQCVAEKLRALPALAKIGGDFDVTLRPLFFLTPENEQRQSGFHQILRYPTHDDDEYVPLGQPVTVGYTPFTPRDVCTAWDKAMPADVIVETMGVLRRGAMFFITTKLPAINVKGDEVERYLGVTSPLDGVTALSAEEWPLRVVCANTLRAAQAGAFVSFHLPHRGDALQEIGEWLALSYRKAEDNADRLKAAFEKLAAFRVKTWQAKTGFEHVYPLPPAPGKEGLAEVIAKRAKRYEEDAARVHRLRRASLELFEGAGTGMRVPAADHTAWGFVHAVAEIEDYRRGSPVGGETFGRTRDSESALFGSRARTKERAMAEALTMVGVNPAKTATTLN